MHILKTILIIIEVLFVFNIMIVVHEIGHFLAARWRGLVIEKFGIWFGKPIWKKTIGGVEYSLGTIPAGGFVALPQLAPMEALEGKVETPREQLPPISALDKIIVAFAGPLFSFGLAVVFAILVWQIGKPVSEADATTTIGYVQPDSPAAKVGLQAGDKILKVNGHAVSRFSGMNDDAITWQIVRSEGEVVPIEIERAGKSLTVNPKPEIEPTHFWQRASMRQIGIVPLATPMVGKVLPNSASEKAGIERNDLVVAVDGEPLRSVIALPDIMAKHAADPLRFTIQRGKQTLEKTLALTGVPVDSVYPNSPAARAGIKSGDVVVSAEINGEKISQPTDLSNAIKKNPVQWVTLNLRRANGEELRVTLKPEVPSGDPSITSPMVGIKWQDDLGLGIQWDAGGLRHLIHPSPVEQVKDGMTAIFSMIDALASKKSDIKLQHMSGPVTIMRVYYMMFEDPQGWRLALWFSVVLNVNLAIMNMLPIPVLDGGHILLAIIESVRRRPVSVRILEVVQSGCAMLIIGFMLYIMFYDVSDWIGAGKSASGNIHFATPSAQSR